MRWKLVHWITVIATDLSGILVRKRERPYSFQDYKNMPEGSLGRLYYETLTQQGFSFKPNLVRHDLKHVLLGYTMDMPDELKIHAFLIGNRSYNHAAILYLLICIAVVPEIIPALKKEYQRGRKSPSLKQVNLFNYVQLNLADCRQQLHLLTPIN